MKRIPPTASTKKRNVTKSRRRQAWSLRLPRHVVALVRGGTQVASAEADLRERRKNGPLDKQKAPVAHIARALSNLPWFWQASVGYADGPNTAQAIKRFIDWVHGLEEHSDRLSRSPIIWVAGFSQENGYYNGSVLLANVGGVKVEDAERLWKQIAGGDVVSIESYELTDGFFESIAKSNVLRFSQLWFRPNRPKK
jgi:hypothetical protein